MHLAFIFIFSSLIGVCVEVYPLLICLWLDMTCLFFSNQCWCFVLVAILKINCFDNHNYFLPYIDEICMFLFFFMKSWLRVEQHHLFSTIWGEDTATLDFPVIDYDLALLFQAMLMLERYRLIFFIKKYDKS